MEKAKYVKTVKDFAYYKLKNNKDFDRKLVKDAFKASGTKHLAFDFKPFSPQKGYVDITMDKGLSMRVGYYAARKDLRVPDTFEPKPGLELVDVPAKDFPGFRKYTDRTIVAHYLRPIKKHVSRDFIKSCGEFSATVLKKCDNACLLWQGKRAGAVSCIDWKLQGGRLGTLVAWVFVDPNLPAAVRENAKTLLTKWMLKHGRGRFGSAEHAKSRVTQKFFSSIGFKPERYIVECL